MQKEISYPIFMQDLGNIHYVVGISAYLLPSNLTRDQ
jgi:hypothetical protein